MSMTLNELKEKWEELWIRFNASPKLYEKIDYLKLLQYLKTLVENSDEGALHEDDLKTINGESVVGEGDIDTSSILLEGNAIDITDNVISVTSHEYDEELNSSSYLIIL